MGWFRNLGSERPWAQGCVIVAAATALAATSCFGFLLTLDFNGSTTALGEALSMAIAVVFGLSALAIPVGVIWFIVGLVKNASKGKVSPPPPASPGGASASG